MAGRWWHGASRDSPIRTAEWAPPHRVSLGGGPVGRGFLAHTREGGAPLLHALSAPSPFLQLQPQGSTFRPCCPWRGRSGLKGATLMSRPHFVGRKVARGLEAWILSRKAPLRGGISEHPYRAPLITEHLLSTPSAVHGWRPLREHPHRPVPPVFHLACPPPQPSLGLVYNDTPSSA